MKKDQNLTDKIIIYLTPEEKNKIYEYMLKNTYYVSFSTMLRDLILNTLFKK